MGGPLGGQDEDHPGGPATGYEVAGERGELVPLVLGADGGGEVGVLVDLCGHPHRSTYAEPATMPMLFSALLIRAMEAGQWLA